MSDLVRVTTEKNIVEAQIAALQLRVKRGELIDRDKAERVGRSFAIRWRDHWMTSPARHAATLAAEFDVDPGLLLFALENYTRRILDRIASEGDRLENDEKSA